MAYNNKEVTVHGILVAAETEKAYGLIKHSDIRQTLNPVSVTNTKEVRDKLNLITFWMPKSQVKNITFTSSNIFSNLARGFQSKINPDVMLYKTDASITLPEWLAIEKKLTGDSGSGLGTDESTPAGKASESW
jgi:hypothetical protein